MLEVCDLTIHHAEQRLVGPLSFSVGAGHVHTIMGPSGSGKSTILNWMIGETNNSFRYSGALLLEGEPVLDLPVEQRRIGILFQDDLLFPHMSVGRNLAFALPNSIIGVSARRQRVDEMLEHIGLSGFHQRDPASLSGGQRARVSVARALIAEPRAVLLDEPFSKLDSTLRTQFRTFVFEWIARQAIPAILVTHDSDDTPESGALTMLTRD
ncbi:ATP-binding cassette domain-containing protein [Pusillimonas sp. ANT_WB101]|uniref:ATP-binding cassette domain-containing protein n=1 Tax=Pusillimonas sp. ANT_WB101 TaxID=2597356 RepID=UPI0011EFFEB0|nr:ATP-binding cassette domain-containing protein [Pusillimonas sp. ANT_WB101]KAA0892869.1 ATP-binding cassette domain-containing protein [Pusillimonas sp. ANT_WB101]